MGKQQSRMNVTGPASASELEQVFRRMAAEPDRWFAASDPGGQRLWVRLAQTDEGRLILTGLVMGAGPEQEITARSLRTIRLDQLLGFIADVAGGPLWPFEPVRVAGAKRLPREHFERIAQAYKIAVQRDPRAPIPMLAQDWKTSIPTMRRWVAECRSRGLLGAALRGRAGEQKPPGRTRDGKQGQ